jgi:hypothetical protein
MICEDIANKNRPQEIALRSALVDIINDIEAQAPVITDTGMIQIWIDVNRLRAARSAIQGSSQ